MNKNDELAAKWDSLLDDGLIEPPAEFHTGVMQRLQQEAIESASMPSMVSKTINAIQAAVVLLGMLAACWQTLAFIFGLWATSIAI